MGKATSLIELILKKWGDDIAGAAKELEEMVGFPESVANRIATGELPMDEASRVARREAQTRPETYYNGGNTGALLEVDPEMSGSARGMSAETGFWGADNGNRASGYAGNPVTENSTVYPFRVMNNSDQMVVDGRGSNWNLMKGSSPVSVKHWNEGEEGYGNIASWTDDYWDTNSIAHMAKDKGDFDSVLFRNIVDSAGSDAQVHIELMEMFPDLKKLPYGSKERKEFMDALSPQDTSEAYRRAEAKAESAGDSIVVFDPNDIRSPNAAFDPQYTGPNIMGGAALPITAGLLAAGQSDDADAGFVTKGGKTLLEAWHGSPHKFDKFSMDQIGTGEGAQRYGHGLYFADSDDVALHYSGGFDDRFTLDGKPYVYPDDMPVELDPDAYDLAVQNTGRYGKEGAIEKGALLGNKGYSDEWIASYNKYVDEVGDRVSFSKTPTGALYRAEIDVTPESLLDWDKPLSDGTPQQMKDSINALVKNNPDLKDDLYQAYREGQPGSVYYSLLSDYAKTGDIVKNQQFATQQLNDAGIKGIKYLDGDSRAVGDGTSNYVIFDDSLINIAERGNADPRLLAGTAAGTGSLLAAPMLADKDKPLPLPTAGDIGESVLNILGLPMTGLQGIARGLFGLATGESFTEAAAQAGHTMDVGWKNGRVDMSNMNPDKGADQLEGYVTDVTGDPSLGWMAKMGLILGSI